MPYVRELGSARICGGNCTNVKNPSDTILEELQDVEKIIHTACTVESAIRGQPVNPHDLRVQTRAAEIILTGVGAEIRDVLENADGERK
jgi:hypothetical protein